jgi:hypothetical protein
LPIDGNFIFLERIVTKRIEDQPAPRGDGTPVWDLVISDMKERDALGRQRYGTPLRTHNGRDALVDAYQEILDLAVYVRQELEERRSIHEICDQVALIPGAEDCTPQNILTTISDVEERVLTLEAANKDLRKKLAALQNESSYDAGFRRGCQASLELVEKLQGKHVSNELLERAMNLRSDLSGRQD